MKWSGSERMRVEKRRELSISSLLIKYFQTKPAFPTKFLSFGESEKKLIWRSFSFSRDFSIFLSAKLLIINDLFIYSSIGDWAVKFGDELWELAETMTKAKEIKQVNEFQSITNLNL